MLTLYGVHRSRASRNIWLLNEIGAHYRLVPVIQGYRLSDPLAPDAPMNTLTESYLMMNPAGGVPFMTDGEVRLTESLAINLYIARTYGGDFGPKDAAEDAVMQQWALFGATGVEPQTEAIKDARGGARAATVAAMTEALRRPIGLLETVINTSGGYVLGDRFTVADINMAEILRYAQSERAFLEGHPAVAGWLNACQARPAFKAMLAIEQAEPD